MTAALGKDEEDLLRLTEASAWRATLFEAGLETSDAFELWLDLDPRNRDAWACVQEPWARFGAEATSPVLIEARQQALDVALRRQGRPSRRRRRWTGRGLVAAALLVLVCGAGFGLWQRASAIRGYETAFGERRTILLQDGSRIDLDSGTRLKVSLQRRSREIELLKGQARFSVAHDAARPFTVRAGDRTVVATGTTFNVDLLGPRLLVTLIEGRVSILDNTTDAHTKPAAPHLVARLVAGQQFAAGDTRGKVAVAPAASVTKVEVDKTTAWVSGQLVFHDEPLSSVTERVSRYSGHPVRADRAVAGLRISGVFNSGDVATFVDAAERSLPVQSAVTPDGSIFLRAAGE
jgi:transmembrane sensor